MAYPITVTGRSVFVGRADHIVGDCLKGASQKPVPAAHRACRLRPDLGDWTRSCAMAENFRYRPR